MKTRSVVLFTFVAITSACSSEDERACPTCSSCEADAAVTVDGAPDSRQDAVPDALHDAVPDALHDAQDAASFPEAGADALPEAEAPGLRIMTFNIKHADISSLEAIADVILAEEPALVGLQEVDVDADRSGNVDQAHRLAQLTGMASLFRSSLTFSSGGYYGLALLSRYPIVSSTKLELSSGSEQRILVVADVETAVGTIAVAITHLGLTAAERLTQAGEITAALAGRQHVILMGDMNAEPGAPEILALTGSFSDAWEQAGSGTGNTIPVSAPTKRIDYVLLGSPWPSASEAYVPSTDASDHLPVVVSVPWP